MRYTLFNVVKPLVAGTTIVTTSENQHYVPIPQAKYVIYGLSSFNLLKTSAVSVIDVNVNMPDTASMLLNTDNTNYLSNVRVSADMWANAVIDCVAQDTPKNAQTSSTSVVPGAVAGVQTAIFAAGSWSYFVQGTDGTTPAPGNVVFTYNAKYDAFTSGSAVEFDLAFAITKIEKGATGNPVSNPANIAPFDIPVTVSVGGTTVYSDKIKVPKLDTVVNTALPFTTTIPITTLKVGAIVNSANPDVVITLSIPRDATKIAGPAPGQYDITYSLTTTAIQHGTVYDPLSDCCVPACPANNGINVVNTPAVCQACTTAGQVYNSGTGSCICKTGFYSVTQTDGTISCVPCSASLC